MVIFGATGDLTGRKLMPALYKLLASGFLPDRFFIVGFARRAMSHDQFRIMMREAIEKNLRGREIDLSAWKKLSANLYYQQGFFEDRKPYEELIPLLTEFDREIGACITRFFYLATPPGNYSSILTHLDKSKLSEGCGQGSSKWTRVLIEKPFGKDLDTAKKLEEQLATVFDEKQIYRIDHYLAKETMQNILAFRFANRPFEAIWNRDHIDHVQITLAESAGIGGRGTFYEGIGALRDIAQNHLMAMIAYTAMDAPKSFSPQDIRNERRKVLSTMQCIEPEMVERNVVRGQYGSLQMEGKEIAAYRQEKDVDPASITETYVALRVYLNHPSFKNVPFYLRTGKRLHASRAQIDIQFKHPTSAIFKNFELPKDAHANILSIRIQPKEGITFRFFAKAPGYSFNLEPVDMDFSYQMAFKKEVGDSYEKLLVDSMMGDQTLFATSSGFYSTWELVTKIMKGWEKLPAARFPNYAPGSWGPEAADDLIQKDGRHWILH